MKKTLIEFAAWSVCEADDLDDLDEKHTIVYAEHYRDCTRPVDPDSSSWGWDFDDGINEDVGVETCWKCDTPVPPEVVALVLLHNYGKRGRYDL